MKAKELGDADVSFISLVKRPANRMPFRITKSEDSINPEWSNFMFNLSNVLKGGGNPQKKAAPSVAALAIKKEDADKLIPVLITKGFTADDQIERDGILILKQESDFNEADLVAFKMDDNVVAMVTNVKKSFHPFTDSMSFAENIASQGFMPGVFVATDALIDTFHNILRGSNNSAEVRNKMTTAIAEYSNFVTAMASDLPEIVFKLEGDQLDLTNDTIKKADEEKPTEDDTSGTADKGTQGTEDVTKGDDSTDKKPEGGNNESAQEEKTNTTKEEVKGSDKVADIAAAEAAQITQAMKGDLDEEILNPSVTKGEDESSTEDKGKTVESESTVSKSDSSDMLNLLTTIQKQLNDGLAGVNGKLEEVEKSTTELSDRLNTVETVAKAAEDAVKGTVLSGSDAILSEGLGNQSRTMKSDTNGDDLWGDTALDNIVG